MDLHFSGIERGAAKSRAGKSRAWRGLSRALRPRIASPEPPSGRAKCPQENQLCSSAGPSEVAIQSGSGEGRRRGSGKYGSGGTSPRTREEHHAAEGPGRSVATVSRWSQRAPLQRSITIQLRRRSQRPSASVPSLPTEAVLLLHPSQWQIPLESQFWVLRIVIAVILQLSFLRVVI